MSFDQNLIFNLLNNDNESSNIELDYITTITSSSSTQIPLNNKLISTTSTFPFIENPSQLTITTYNLTNSSTYPSPPISNRRPGYIWKPTLTPFCVFTHDFIG